MITKKLPCCYFPTTTLLVDDNRNYLNLLALKLNWELPCRTYHQPESALAHIKQQTKETKTFITKLFSRSSTIDADFKATINIDVNAIHEQVYNRERFQAIPVVVVDYAMPEMDGLEFCKQLAGFPIKKIMLTGEADHVIAVDAFNQGIIDQFFLKDSIECFKKLKTSILDLQKTYFQEISEPIIQSLTANSASCLIDDAFIDVFNDICNQYKIVEYYLLDTSGSFILLNNEGKASLLIVKDEEDMQFQHELAQGLAIDEVAQAIENRSQLLFFPNIQSYANNPKQWQRYKANVIKGKHNYYYALLPELEEQIWAKSKILSADVYGIPKVASVG